MNEFWPDYISLWARLTLLLAIAIFEFGLILANINQHHGKYDLQVDDLKGFCPLAGFDEFDPAADARSEGKACFQYRWIPEPCTLEKSGRIESDLLHCGHYSMVPCTDTGLEDRTGGNPGEGLFGFDVPWPEVADLCDVVNIKNRTKKKRKVRPMYWKWTFCENEKGTELRPCGHYAMTLYPPGKEPKLQHSKL